MPFFSNFKDEEDEKLEQQQQGQGPTLSGQTGGAFNDPNQGGVNKTPSAPSSSGRFTPIQKYLEANRGGQVTEKLVDPMGARWGEARTGLQQGEAGFNTEVESNRVRVDQGALDEAANNAAKVNADPTKKAGVLKQRDAQYKGPGSVQDNEAARTGIYRANEADREVESSKTESGRINLVESLYRRPTSTRGEGLLDQMLLQNDPDANAKLRGYQGQYDTLDQDANAFNERGNALATGAAADTKAAKEAFTKTVGGKYGTSLVDATNRYQKAGTDYGNNLSAAQLGLSQGTLSPELMQMLGINDGEEYFDLVNPTSYLSPRGTPTYTGAQSKEQAAELDALSQLTGQLSPFSDLSQAGSYDPSKAIGFDRAGFDRDVGSARNTYTNELNQRNAPLAGMDQRLQELASSLANSAWGGEPPPDVPQYSGEVAEIRALKEEQARVQAERDALAKTNQDWFGSKSKKFRRS